MHKLATAIALFSVLTLAACGRQEQAGPSAPTTPPATSQAPAPAAPPAATTPATPAPTAPATTAAPAAAPAATTAAAGDVGKSVYGKTCSLCHAAGVAGAPKPGDKVDWAPRIAQGNDLLYKHALEGFTGAKGVMPARGGGTHTDQEVKAAVDYMVAQSR